jgi:hypothetical protein
VYRTEGTILKCGASGAERSRIGLRNRATDWLRKRKSSKPRVEALNGSDIMGLIGAGMCFGVAFVGLIGRLKVRNE